ncbi:21756_t:CDS:2 [Rhizophagus irregularis]|nr:21756_t:CDS:2 [Rhizophagus irregularis]
MIQQSRVISRTISSINNVSQQQHHSTPMNITPSHVVPTQTLNVQPLISLDSTMQDVSQSIAEFSMPNDLPIDFSLDQSPTICYDSDKKSCQKNSVRNDVFFSDPMIEDTEEVLHFDSDSSSDTDILTPRQRYSPPLSPIDFGDDLIWNMLDLSKDKPFTETTSTNMSEVATVSSTSSDLNVNVSKSSDIISSPVTTIPPPPSSMNVSITSSSNSSSSSNLTTIDPTLIRTTPETIDPRFIETTSSNSVSPQNVVVKKLPPSVITRPNHIEFGDGIPSPPLRTPELVSDHSIKRRLSCESSSDDDISDAESNDKRAQKKFKVDIKNDTVTDEYHYSSDTESEEDDDEEYRPSNNNKKSRTRKVVKSQGKARAALSKGSPKTKSSSIKNKSKVGKQSSKTSKPSSKRSSGANTPASLPIESPPQCFATPVEESNEMEGLEVTSPRPTQSPTIFQTLTKSGIDWCRYCGTTEGVNWRPGPWGKRTLCNKHGCDYKGYGFACKLPRLDLTGFVNESVEDRDRPVLQLFCTVCQKQESYMSNVLVRCEGCFKAFHQKCFSSQITDETVSSSEQWFCEAGCSDNVRRKRIVQVPVPNIETGSVPSGTTSRPRTSRNSSRV